MIVVTPRTSRIMTDRKSTRLNSSHRTNSYAVFCLKKKLHIDHQRVALPRGGGISQPAWWGICGEFAAIQKDLTPKIERFINDNNESRRLNQFPWRGRRVDARHSLRQAIGGLIFF